MTRTTGGLWGRLAIVTLATAAIAWISAGIAVSFAQLGAQERKAEEAPQRAKQATREAQQVEIGPEWNEVENWTAHDLDTWTQALVRWGKTEVYVRKSLRLSACDALEVSYIRQQKLREQGASLIDYEEIRKGKAGLARFERETQGGRRFVRIVDAEAAYGRWEVDMRVRLPSGEILDVADWIKANGFERGSGR